MITLASDFGSPYPAAVRGVLLSNSDARLVDVTHDLPRGDVRASAFWLREVLPWFPPAVHLAVIDPGVGTERNALVVRAGDHLLVGPDNGVLVPPARALADGADGDLEAFRIRDEDAASSTFHGRDVFAPAAAAVHDADHPTGVEGVEPVAEFEEYSLPAAEFGERSATGEVLVVDDFGNAITNVPGSAIEDHESVRVDAGTCHNERVPVVETFDSVRPGERLVTVGSHGNVELDVNRGRGDEAFGVEPGYEVVLKW